MLARCCSVIRRSAAAVSTLAVLTACDPGSTSPLGEAGLQLAISPVTGFVTSADRAVVHLGGPTIRRLTAVPGQTTTIGSLLPGSYLVSVEGFAGSEVEWFDETRVTVVVGQSRTASVSARSFTPSSPVAPSSVDPGESFQVSWGMVGLARMGYRLEIADNASFSSPTVRETTDPSASLQESDPGTYYLRARAVNEFESVSVPSGTATVVVSAAILAYVANLSSDNISVIDVGTESVTNTIDVGDAPLSVAFSPDGSVASVVNSSSDDVSVIDVGTKSVDQHDRRGRCSRVCRLFTGRLGRIRWEL